jgi:hypothetical protein
MRPSQRPGAELTVFPQRRDVPVFKEGGNLRVAKLPEVVVATIQSARPAEEMSLADCMRRWPATTRSPWFGCRDLPA